MEQNKLFSFMILAGGTGNRMKNSVPKQFLQLGGRPVITHIMERIEPIQNIHEVIVVCDRAYEDTVRGYIAKFDLKKQYYFAPKGETRQASVRSGLLKAACSNVIVHEAARPFVTAGEFQRLMQDEHENCTYGSPIPFTVLECSGDRLTGLLDRSALVNIQLPQKFKTQTLLKAHDMALAEDREFTEDASMLLAYELGDVYVLEGSSYNIKLTDPMDMLFGETIYKEYFAKRR